MVPITLEGWTSWSVQAIGSKQSRRGGGQGGEGAPTDRAPAASAAVASNWHAQVTSESSYI